MDGSRNRSVNLTLNTLRKNMIKPSKSLEITIKQNLSFKMHLKLKIHLLLGISSSKRFYLINDSVKPASNMFTAEKLEKINAEKFGALITNFLAFYEFSMSLLN